MFNFQDKVVLAVGGAGYLSAPACKQFAALGASVVVTDLDESKAEAVATQIKTEYSSQAAGWSCDVSQLASIDHTIEATIEKFGKLDILVNAAYKGAHGSSLDEMPAQAFTDAAQVQLTGSFHLARAAARVMQSGSSMVFFSSMYGRISPEPAIYHPPMLPNPIDYGVVKAGLEQMIRYLAVHYAPRNIRVNGVAPGAFPHPAEDTPEWTGFLQRLAEKAPMNRIGREDELAGPILFLTSDIASFVTGQTLVVDGGWTIW